MKKESVIILVGALLLAGGYFLSEKGFKSTNASDLNDLETICSNGQQAAAILDPNYTIRSTKPCKNCYPTNQFQVQYHFIANGETINGEMTLDSVPPTLQMQVWYSKSDPKRYVWEEPCAKLSAAKATTVPAWYLYLGIPMAILGGLLIFQNAKHILGGSKSSKS